MAHASGIFSPDGTQAGATAPRTATPGIGKANITTAATPVVNGAGGSNDAPHYPNGTPGEGRYGQVYDQFQRMERDDRDEQERRDEMDWTAEQAASARKSARKQRRAEKKDAAPAPSREGINKLDAFFGYTLYKHDDDADRAEQQANHSAGGNSGISSGSSGTGCSSSICLRCCIF